MAEGRGQVADGKRQGSWAAIEPEVADPSPTTSEPNQAFSLEP
jgi:hypothetical protein